MLLPKSAAISEEEADQPLVKDEKTRNHPPDWSGI